MATRPPAESAAFPPSRSRAVLQQHISRTPSRELRGWFRLPRHEDRAIDRILTNSPPTRPEYDEALAVLQSLQHELEDRNPSAAGSLAEGLDETLTLHRLGVYGVLGRSLKTTNGLESINALIEERCAKVDHWQNSSQRQRWLATALLDIEPRLRKVMGYRHLPRLRDALKRELKIDTTTSKTKAA